MENRGKKTSPLRGEAGQKDGRKGRQTGIEPAMIRSKAFPWGKVAA